MKRMRPSSNPLVAVTGSQRPYIYDLPLLLSLPNGFEYRFRYQPIWVSDEINDAISSSSKRADLVGRDLIIVFHSQEQQRLIPVRKCSLISIDDFGAFVFLRFVVGPFAKVTREAILAKPDSPERR